jgi:hypothetical protein
MSRKPLILDTPGPTDVQKAYPAIAKWVQGYGHIEIGQHAGLGFIVRALASGRQVFLHNKPGTLADAMEALEQGLARWFNERWIE